MSTLPALREELALYAGPAAGNGAPTWSLLDPARNQFFRIDWLTFEILSRWDMDDPQEIAASIRRDTTLDIESSDLEQVLKFLSDNELLRRSTCQGTQWLHTLASKRRQTFAQKLLHHYLFFRIPLLRPDGWLTRTQRYIDPLYSESFLWITLVVLLLGLVEVSRQWDRFMVTLIDTFSWQGLLSYAFALVFIKFLHELGHAYTAKRYGCRVPTMGVAFLVLFPVAYTDVNDAWRLRKRRQRLAVGAAGMLTELAVAAWATLAWAMLPEGQLRNTAFVLATITWISSIAINTSPFMRFDGYFLLSDWLDIPNLHQRAFGLGRWQLRAWLFGLAEPAPEIFPVAKQRGLVLFAYATWIYRLVVFSAIAALVYHMVPKPFGPLLAAIEIGWFILKPIQQELWAWRDKLFVIVRGRRSLFILGVLAALIALATVPWDRRVQSQGLLKPTSYFTVVAPGAARIGALPHRDGEVVAAGEILLVLSPPELHYQQQATSARLTSLDWQVALGGLDEKLRTQQPVIEKAADKARAELKNVQDKESHYALKAPFSGRFYLNHPDLRPAHWVSKNEELGLLISPGEWTVETYLTENDLHRVAIGDRGRFYSEASDSAPLDIEVTAIDRDATRVLPQAILASTHGGAILVRESQGSSVPEKAVYRVTLTVAAYYRPHEPRFTRGRVVLYGQPLAPAAEFMRAAAALFLREAEF